MIYTCAVCTLRLLIQAALLMASLGLLLLLTGQTASASCCEDFAEGGLSISYQQIEDMGFGVVKGQQVHIAPEGFAERFIAVAYRESRYNPLALGKNGKYNCIGLLQLCTDSAMMRLVTTLGYTEQDLYDIDINIIVAEWWWRATGKNWSHWEGA